MRACLLRMAAAVLWLGLAVLPAHAESDWKAFSTAGGQVPQPLVLHDLSGQKLDLASLKGQVVLVNFWATWCEPCKDDMPSLSSLHKKLGARGFKVVGVNLGESRGRIEQFLNAVPVGFPVLRDDDSAASKAWRVRVLPASFLLDRRGMLRYQLVGDADWDDPAMQAPILELLKDSK